MECSGTRVRHHQSWAWGKVFGVGVCEGQQGKGKGGEAPNQSGAPTIGQIRGKMGGNGFATDFRGKIDSVTNEADSR